MDIEYKYFSKINYLFNGKYVYLVVGSLKMFIKLIKFDVKIGRIFVIRIFYSDDFDFVYYSNFEEVSWSIIYDEKVYGYYYLF